MNDIEYYNPGPKEPLDIHRIGVKDLWGALRAGWFDFRQAPWMGLFFSSVYVLGGLALADVFGATGYVEWTVILALGFPLIAPFAAVGFYEISNRIDRGLPLDWLEIVLVVFNEKDRQIPWIGAIIVIAFLFWSFLAHLIFALFMGLSVMTNISSSYEVFFTTQGLTMIAVELVVAGIFFFILFAITVFSLPLLLDREIDFVTAMIVSVRTVLENFWVMFFWGEIILVLLFIGMMPYFLGLLVVLPVLGHATWHLYRRVSSTSYRRV